MKFSAAFAPGHLGLSFELFPPKTAAGDAALFRHLEQLIEFKPDVITCTYGAGGSTRDKTLDVVTQVHGRFGCGVAAHLTCVGSTTEQLRDYLHQARQRDVDNIVALRGDPPAGQTHFQPVAGGLAHANELVALIRADFPEFGIAVGGYPETHREAISAEDDLRHLQRKVDAGADVVITQLFYNNDDFFRFRDRCAALGITVPLVPGLLPVTSLAQIQRISSLCGAQLPADFIRNLVARKDDLAGQFETGVEHTTRQTQALLDAGVPGLHFYVLNRSAAASRVLRNVMQH